MSVVLKITAARFVTTLMDLIFANVKLVMLFLLMVLLVKVAITNFNKELIIVNTPKLFKTLNS